MKRFLFLIIFIISSNSAVADISDYIRRFDECVQNESYKTFSDVIRGSASVSDIEKQHILDREIENELNSSFIYTDLEECIKIAFNDNFDILLKRAEKDASFWTRKNAQFSLLPDLIYNYDIQNLGGKYLVGGIVSANTHEVPIQSILIMQWSTVNKGKYFFNLAKTKNLFNSASSQLEYTKDETLLKTVLAYYDTLEKKMEIEVQKSNLYERLEQLKYTKARYDAGLGDLYDVKRAQAELAGAKQDYATSLNKLRLSQASLANVIGVDVYDAIYPFEISVDHRQLVNPDMDIEELYRHALESRDDIKAKRAEIEAYKAQRNMNYSDIIPDVSISYQNGFVGTKRVGLAGHNSLTLDVSVSLGKNLLAGTVTSIKADNAVIRAKEIELIQLKRQIRENILNSFFDCKTLLEKIEAAKMEVEAASLSIELAMSSMKAGESTFIDVISSQNLKIQADLNLIRYMIEYNKKQTQLLFDTGTVSPENILKGYKTKYY